MPTRRAVENGLAHRGFWIVVALAAAYFMLGKAGLAAAALSGNVTPVWPPTGLAIAALVMGGIRLWPGVALGALAINGLSEVPLGTACGMAVGNTLEALVGALLFHRLAGADRSLSRVRDVLAVVVLSAGVATLCSATIGVISLHLGGVVPSSELWTTWRVWWVGDVLGALVFAPFLMQWLARTPAGAPRMTRARRLEAGLLAGCLVGLALATFSTSVGYAYLVFPPVIFAALRFGQRGVTAGVLLVCGIAVLGTRAGNGPFAAADPTQSLWRLDTYLAVLAVTGLVLAAVVSERDRAASANAELTAELRRHVTELKYANSELEAFAYSVSHDLRAPLRNIDGFSRNLQKRAGEGLDDESRRYLERIRSNSKSMGHLIDELLAFSRLQRQPLQTTTVDVGQVVEEALGLLESSRPSRTDPHIAVGPMPTVEADRGLLVQVFVNLIGNAIKFSRGRAPGLINLACRPDPATGERVFTVTDNGVGFDMRYADKIFGVFQRLHRMEDYEGSGVGLALVARIVTRHGGRIWAQSTVDGGATFHFTLGGDA